MRSAPRWAWPCSRPWPWPPAAGSRSATGTASRSLRPSRAAWRASQRCWSRRSGPRPEPAWRCTEMPTVQRLTRYQREVAERNVEAILDAAEELVQQGQANISAVAAMAGVSRVTVYAHFPTWQALLEAAVERAVRRTMAALQSVHPEDGPPVEALDRMIAAAWQHLARYEAMAAAVAELLSPEAITRTHQAAHHTVGALLRRGQADGSFRTDLPAGWLVTASIALVHACSDQVRAGQIDEHDAVGILTTSIRDLFTGTQPEPSPLSPTRNRALTVGCELKPGIDCRCLYQFTWRIPPSQ